MKIQYTCCQCGEFVSVDIHGQLLLTYTCPVCGVENAGRVKYDIAEEKAVRK